MGKECLLFRPCPPEFWSKENQLADQGCDNVYKNFKSEGNVEMDKVACHFMNSGECCCKQKTQTEGEKGNVHKHIHFNCVLEVFDFDFSSQRRKNNDKNNS